MSEKDKTFSLYLEKGKTIRKKAKLLSKLPPPPSFKLSRDKVSCCNKQTSSFNQMLNMGYQTEKNMFIMYVYYHNYSLSPLWTTSHVRSSCSRMSPRPQSQTHYGHFGKLMGSRKCIFLHLSGQTKAFIIATILCFHTFIQHTLYLIALTLLSRPSTTGWNTQSIHARS
jgi:hypothetical protein